MRVAVLPTRNEAMGLPRIVEKLRRRVDTVLVIDDDSEDATGQIANRLGCVVLRNECHKGYGATLRRGLLWCLDAGACTTISVDADGQHDPVWIDEGLSILDHGADVVFGNRFAKLDGIPETKVLSNNFAWDCVKRCIGRKPICEDVSCGFRIYGSRGLGAAVASDATATSGYAFTHATCVSLHDSGLRLDAVNIPAIYFDPVLGTHVTEMKDFLTWLELCTPLRKDSRYWLDCVRSGQDFRLEFEAWHSGAKVLVIARRMNQFVQLSLDG